MADRSLLPLLAKIEGEISEQEKAYILQILKKYLGRRATIKIVYEQLLKIFQKGEKPKGRIVSIHKDCLPQIVRSKEIKLVELVCRQAGSAPRSTSTQIDGISFIDQLNFNAFYEGNRFQALFLKHSV